MSTNNTKHISVEIAKGVGIAPFSSSSYYVDEKTKFSEALLMAIRRFELNTNPRIQDWIVTTRRSPKTTEFPIAASENQIQSWQREQKFPKKVIPAEELEWSYEEIINKYQVTIFHVEKKT